jgi:cell filamentation protein
MLVLNRLWYAARGFEITCNGDTMAPVRYVVSTGPEAEYEPGSRGRVLRNLLGIRRKRDMDRTEHEALVQVQAAYQRRSGPDTCFTAAMLRQMHRDWMGGIYEWAGEYRTVEVQKGDFRWPPAYLVPRNMDTLEQNLLFRNTPCCPGGLAQVAWHVAQVHAELLLIHPFREGNGRLARWLADLMAFQAGLPPPDYAFRGKGSVGRRMRYLQAVSQGYLREYEALATFFAEALQRRLRELPGL